MTDKEEKEPEGISLPPEVEAEIAVIWSDNVSAAQLTRTVARALVHQGYDTEKIRDRIRNSGRVVE